MAFTVGQRVTLHKPFYPGMMRDDESFPIFGVVYTIRGFDPDGDALLLKEIVNPPHYAGRECSFYNYLFRPLIERKTDISIFEAMLSPDAIEKAKECV